MRLRALTLGVFLVLSASWAQASSIPPTDPRIATGGGGGTTFVSGNTFTITIDSGGGGIFDFINNSPNTWFNILISSPLVQTTPITCVNLGTSWFTNCTVSPLGSPTSILFSGGTGVPGNGIGFIFFDFNDVNSAGVDLCPDCGSWQQGTYQGVANVPEPGTVALLGMGLAALAGCRSLRKRRGGRA